ncbi:MAG TPA: hypothetical protein VJ694_02140, partial [Patescibacteria group bacterium]|nr:hypothetical protein [Patescibacteria group bacterium]
MEISIKRISYLSSLGFMIVFALACASSGCVTVENDVHVDCGGDDDGGTTVVVVTIPPDEVQPTEPTDPQGPAVPKAAPYVSAAPLPSYLLLNGTQIFYRTTFTAPVESDVLVKKLSFAVGVVNGYPPGVALYAPGVRVVGEGSDLPGVASISDAYTESVCGFSTSPANRCVSLVLASPLIIEAGTSVTVDFRMTSAATWSDGDSVTTSLARDAAGGEEGILVGEGLDAAIGGGKEGLLWSNDDVWFYDGHDVIGT